MKPGSTEAQARRRKDAFWGTAQATVFRLAAAAILLWARWDLPAENFWAKALLILLVLDLGMIVPIWINFKRRLKEIEGGEEDAAAQY